MSDPKTPSPRSAALEQAPSAVRREAQRLLANAGSPEEAQRAVDSATGKPEESSAAKDAFSRRWNFGSYLEMFEASKPLTSSDGRHWLVTNVGGERWVVWNDEELSAAYTVGSVQEAAELIGASGVKPGEGQPPPTG